MGSGAIVAQNHGGFASNRGNGEIDREFGSNENQRRIAAERPQVKNLRSSPGDLELELMAEENEKFIATLAQLRELLSRLPAQDRIAIDTEADSLHCYREKLCLLQLSIPDSDFVLDPLALENLESLAAVLKDKEIVLHGADFVLRLLRRGIGLVPDRVFDTVIAARLLGLRQFSLAALVHKYFNVELPKGSQKANWARRPLPRQMLAYAINDTHYLLGLAEKMESELAAIGRLEWFRQSCQRAIEQAAMD